MSSTTEGERDPMAAWPQRWVSPPPICQRSLPLSALPLCVRIHDHTPAPVDRHSPSPHAGHARPPQAVPRSRQMPLPPMSAPPCRCTSDMHVSRSRLPGPADTQETAPESCAQTNPHSDCPIPHAILPHALGPPRARIRPPRTQLPPAPTPVPLPASPTVRTAYGHGSTSAQRQTTASSFAPAA